ncbi:hypothetical protein FSPOR_6107 [Fusarium sporotrichioides]|uniref:Uncharacterized protein n=1 Tax=Fusarium sporotrichioides TaxID=5514 RepID=A0A395S534_FUSSP|nr:hypothetical protein FSPOR_6107 [Fusarium sporotrichioides]
MSEEALESFADAEMRQITGHTIDRPSRKVQFTVQWHRPNDVIATTSTFSEAAVQEIDEKLVLEYWKDAGGRSESINLGKNHIFKIVSERPRF